LHVTSLPGGHGVGDLGPAAEAFADFLARAGQRWWQMLPVGPSAAANSPYSSYSAFAGDPLLLSLDRLAQEGLLKPADLEPRPPSGPKADYAAAAAFKFAGFRKAFEAFGDERSLEAFRRRRRHWLPGYALFRALKDAHGQAPWWEWEQELRDRRPEALVAARRRLADEIRFREFLQYMFERQWAALRAVTQGCGIGLIGDVPIFLSHDSADVWEHPDLFQLDERGRPLVVAGTPPDYFCRTGQLWGNPIYRWEEHRARGYDWWIQRLRATFERFDAVRLDHFIGFARYWAVPAQAPTAEAGEWRPGPGAELFEKVFAALGPIPLIAEDLGSVTPEVIALRDRFELPGMKVLQFSFGDEADAVVLRDGKVPRRSVIYTGTHDNDTAVGWFGERASPGGTRTAEQIARERARVLACVGTDGREIHWDLIELAHRSGANTAIVPAQDLLGLGSEARMNVPGRPEGNWEWRLAPGLPDEATAARLRRLTEATDRATPPPREAGAPRPP
jgi:4-alpha-glucanotransferase